MARPLSNEVAFTCPRRVRGRYQWVQIPPQPLVHPKGGRIGTKVCRYVRLARVRAGGQALDLLALGLCMVAFLLRRLLVC
eukprot:15468176-Alexandrium_andersonii.AAC.1